MDYRYSYFGFFRAQILTVSYPLQWFVDAPYRFVINLKRHFQLHQTLLDENSSLRKKQFELETRLQKFTALKIENTQLRELLRSSQRTEKDKIVAEIMWVEPDPFTQQVFINKGKDSGVNVGQPVIDAKGILGIVIDAGKYSSKILLLTDSSYGIPVESARNGIRGIAVGTGNIDQILLQHMPKNTDIQPGDKLLTSGLGGKYPRGYPVGIVNQVIRNPGEAFARISVTPTAQLQSSRQVLVLQELVEN